jgi:hypothetical protein
MVRCAACHRSFTVSGYTLHVMRLGSQACVAAHLAQMQHADTEAFSGDFFGDYQDNDFDWPNDKQEPADCRCASTFCHQTIFIEDPDFDDEDELGCIDEETIDVVRPTSPTPANVPQYEIELFPLATAGAPIPGTVHGSSSFESYQRAIGSNNSYAPFSSMMDWEFAKWAKLHGPSSSAMTQLLKTKGVRQ